MPEDGKPFSEPDARKHSNLTCHVRLLLVLDWLRIYGHDYCHHVQRFEGNSLPRSQVHIATFIASISAYQIIIIVSIVIVYLMLSHPSESNFSVLQRCSEWPAAGPFTISTLEGVSGAIDCTAHYRRRVHSGQADYRGDKRRHFMTAQVTTGLNQEIFTVALGKGHNNDQVMLELTGMKDPLSMEFRADGEYRFMNLVIPDDKRGVAWNNTQTS
jgi:hypothetical protein